MVIKVDDTNQAAPPRYYWRANTYEKYTGRGWATDATNVVDYQAGEQTTGESTPTQRLVRQQVQIIGNLGKMVYATGTLLSADHDFQVEWRSQADNDLFGASIEANVYQVESLVPVVSELELRAAGNNYSDWIRTRYLNLPGDVPERVLALA